MMCVLNAVQITAVTVRNFSRLCCCTSKAASPFVHRLVSIFFCELVSMCNESVKTPSKNETDSLCRMKCDPIKLYCTGRLLDTNWVAVHPEIKLQINDGPQRATFHPNCAEITITMDTSTTQTRDHNTLDRDVDAHHEVRAVPLGLIVCIS